MNNKLTAVNNSNLYTDSPFTVRVSSTSTFLANKHGGATSIVTYTFMASKYPPNGDISIDYGWYTASYPAITTINGFPNRGAYEGWGILYPGQDSVTTPLTLGYKNVNAKSSPRIAKFTLTALSYLTDQEHILTVDSASGSSEPICQVNNIAHLTFVSPKKYKVFSNGQTEIADVLLSGDTTWTLNSLPINYYYTEGSSGSFPNKITAKYSTIVKAVDSTVLRSHSAVLVFKNGFVHHAGITDTLRIYASNMFINPGGNQFITELGDLNKFIWLDGIGGHIGGKLNSQFYKEPTGQAHLNN